MKHQQQQQQQQQFRPSPSFRSSPASFLFVFFSIILPRNEAGGVSPRDIRRVVTQTRRQQKTPTRASVCVCVCVCVCAYLEMTSWIIKAVFRVGSRKVTPPTDPATLPVLCFVFFCQGNRVGFFFGIFFKMRSRPWKFRVRVAFEMDRFFVFKSIDYFTTMSH